MPDLVLGPLLRFTGETDATVWVETDAACEVEVLGCSSPTFRVGSHHYALVHVEGLDLTGRILARLVRISREPISWRLTHDAAFFDNQIATLELGAESATITFEKAVIDASKEPALKKLYRHRLA